MPQKKNVDAAAKLIGIPEKAAEARRLIKEASSTEPTINQARTYYVATLIEWRDYEADIRKREINPKDATVTDLGMADKIMNGYQHLLKALELDSVPNRKGKIKPQYSRDLIGMLDAHAFDLYRAGAIYYNNKKYYPEAYNGFISAARHGKDPRLSHSMRLLNDTVIADAYYFAGLSAYASSEYDKALEAFESAASTGMNSPELLLYQMTIWETLARKDKALEHKAHDALLRLSKDGYYRYGIKHPAFLSRMTQIFLADGRTEEILGILNHCIQMSPKAWLPYGLRGWANEQAGNDVESVNDYKMAASLPYVSAQMLLRGAHKLYRFAHQQKNSLSGSKKKQRAQRDEIITQLLEPAKVMAVEASKGLTDQREIELVNNLLENIDYDESLLK